MSEVLRVLQDDTNFHVELIDWNGVAAIHKRVQPGTDERRRATLQNEIIGTEYFYYLSTENPDWNFHVPKTFDRGEGWVVREYIDGEELLRVDESAEHAARKLAQLATLLAQIDVIEPDPTIWELSTNSAPYTNITKRLPVWSEKPLQHGTLTTADYTAANDLIQGYQPFLQPRLAHGDMNPLKHAFETSGGELAWIDFEHFSAQKPRYYDVA